MPFPSPARGGRRLAGSGAGRTALLTRDGGEGRTADVGRVPITAKLVADLLSVGGADRVLALDLHAAQIQGFFDIPVDHLHAGPVLVDYVRSLGIPPRDLVVLSPDAGSIKKALLYQKKLGGAMAIVDKR